MEGADRSLETLLQDSKQSLDGDMRSALVSAFLNCNPKRCPILPTFRLEELLAACTSIDRKRSGDIQTIESLLSLFTLTVYFGLTTNHDSAFTAKMIKRLYIWTTESIAIDLTMGSKFFAMSDLSTVFDRQPSIDPSNKLEIFSNSLEIAKLILRDTLTLSRDLKNPHRLRDEKQIPKNPDCVKPQTIYFMACFSLCHISLVLHSQSRISILPGLVEALLMFVLTKPALDASNAESSSQTTVSTSPLCLASKAHDLAVFSAHCVFQPRVLQDVILVRSRMARHLLQPAIEYAQFRATDLKAFISSSVGNMRSSLIGSLRSKNAEIGMKNYHFLQGTRCLADFVSVPDGSDDDDESSSLSLRDDIMGKSTPTMIKIVQHYASIRKAYKMAFLIMQSHHLPRPVFTELFERTYKALPFHFPPGNLCSVPFAPIELPASKASVILEGVLFSFVSDGIVPRFLDPKDELYWIMAHLIEILYKKSNEGTGFCPPKDHEEKHLAHRLRESAAVRASRKRETVNLEMALKQVKTEAILEQRLLDLELNRDQQPERPTSKSNNALAATLLESGISSGFSVKREMTQIPSVVWYCPPKKAMKTRQLVTMGVESFSDNPLESMPSQAASAEYARQIAQQKLLRQQEEIKEKLTLEDLQHEIIAKNRAQKNAALRATKERVKEEIEAKNALKASLNAEKLRIAAEMEQKLAREIRAKEEAELLETLRIRDIQANKRDQQRREAEEYAMQLEVEKMLIARVSSEQEAQEIIRRNKEEDRMRYLEERRRVLEARKEQQAQEEMARREANKVKAMEAANEIQARLRRGNFVWHNGQLGFYDNVRREVKEYVQYEDSYGRPYFYDPVYGTYQYRLPEDADVHHHIEDERKEYDAVHGEGAYDAYKADIAFKDSVNQYGGYYDEHGRWIEANGYYDENYNWVAYEGYYNEQGKYIRFAKISGDLNFMV